MYKRQVVTFEQLGVDRLFVDEAHNYKNLFLYTKMRNVDVYKRQNVVGAIWVRIMNDYGHIDNDTPVSYTHLWRICLLEAR